MRSLVITIQGTVQKIGLRSSVLELAKSHGWKGEIKNHGDNEVLITLQDETIDALDFLKMLKKINPRLKADHFHVQELDLPAFSTFTILPS